MLPRDQTVDVTPTCRWVKEFHAVTNVLACAIKLSCLGCITVRALHRLSTTRSAKYLVVPTFVGEDSQR